jgi:hypothetical protein
VSDLGGFARRGAAVAVNYSRNDAASSTAVLLTLAQ